MSIFSKNLIIPEAAILSKPKWYELSILNGQNCMLRADLGADGTPRTHDRIDLNHVILYEKGRACKLIDTIFVIFTFVTDKKRLTTGFLKTPRVQRTNFFGYHHRNPFKIQGFFDGINTLFNPVRPDNRDVGYPNSPDDLFNRHHPVPVNVQFFHINTGMRLMPGHGGGAVIKNYHGKIMVIIDGIN